MAAPRTGGRAGRPRPIAPSSPPAATVATEPAGDAIRLLVRPDAGSVRDVLIRVAADLADFGVGPLAAGSVELVLAEVLNNVVEHAFSGRDGGRIEVTLAPRPSHIVCIVRDNGRPMPHDRLPSGTAPAPGDRIEDLPEGGFGWFLIHNLACDLAYARDDRGNLLRFCVPTGDAPGSATEKV